MTNHERAVMQQALEALECVDLQSLVPDYGSGHYSVARLDGPQVKSAITALRAALAQQALPMSEQKRKDGKYKVLYRCQDCGHDQWITEIVAHGATYTGGSANWCDACDNGLPVRVDPMQQSEPVYYEVSSGVTHNLWMRVSKSQYDEYIRSGWDGRTLHALAQQNITDSNKEN